MTKLRPFMPHDGTAVEIMMREEGFLPEDCSHDRHTTMVLVDEDDYPIGFFTVKLEHGMPYLEHLCLDSMHRNINNARALIKGFVDKAREMGYKKAIVHTGVDKVGAQKLLVHYFRKAFYSTTKDSRFMLVEV